MLLLIFLASILVFLLIQKSGESASFQDKKAVYYHYHKKTQTINGKHISEKEFHDLFKKFDNLFKK